MLFSTQRLFAHRRASFSTSKASSWSSRRRLLLLGAGGAGLLAIGGTFFVLDHHDRQMLSRPLQFWFQVLPIVTEYYWTDWTSRNVSDELRDSRFERLHVKHAQTALQLILQLRGIYIKVGQVGSMRGDLFPEAYRTAFRVLLDRVPGEEGDKAIEIIERAMGKPSSTIFSYISPLPIGAASIGQVHKAVIASDGRECVIKIQYPNCRQIFQWDIRSAKLLARLVRPEMLGILNEIEKQVLKEFDFDREARALSHMRRHLMPRFNNVIIPEPFLEYCNNQMIIMEYIPGVRLLDGVMDEFKSISRRLGVDFDSLRNGQQPISLSLRLQFSTLYFLDSFFDLAHTVIATCFNYTLGLGFGKMSYPKHKIDKKTVMKTLIDIQGYQILIGRLFQGDPHLGNFLITPEGKIGCLDYGQVKGFAKRDARLYATMLKMCLADDKDGLVKLAESIGFKTENSDPYVIYKTIIILFDRFDKSVSEGMEMREFMESLREKDRTKSIPEQFVLAVRSNMMLRGISRLFQINNLSLAKEWERYADFALKEYPSNAVDDEIVEFN